MTPLIEARGLVKRFGTTTALNDLDLTVEPGQVLAVLGPNGAGKTTFVRLVATLLRPDQGELRVAGHDVRRDPEAVRRVIGLAGQFAAIEPAMTGRENLELVARLYGMDARASRAGAAAVLERFGLAEAADRLVRTYSGGMRRKLDLGASLVSGPRLLLLDEPTTGLDPGSRLELWDAIDELADQGTGVLLTTQYLDEADRLAGRLLIIDRGRRVASGVPHELKRQVGGTILEVEARDPADLPRIAAALAGRSGQEPRVDATTRRVSVGVGTDGLAGRLLDGVRDLEDQGVGVVGVGVRQPSLDEVFLALTDRRASDGARDEHAAEILRPPSGRPEAGHAPPEPAPGQGTSAQVASAEEAQGVHSPVQGVPVGVAERTPARDARSRGARAGNGRVGAGVVAATALVAKRALLTFMRTPQLIVLSTLQMAIFMVGFRYVFGGAIGWERGVSYVDFAVPGFVAAGVLYTTLGTATAMAEDLQNGLIDRMRSLPMPRSAVLFGRVLADAAVLTWSLAVTVAIGFAIGFRLGGTVLEGIAAFAMCLLFGLTFSWVFIVFGLLLKDVRATQSLLMVVFIFTFVSNAYVPASTMPGWLQSFAENQPVSPMVNAVRALALGEHGEVLLGHPASYFVMRSLAWGISIAAVFVGFSVAVYRRR